MRNLLILNFIVMSSLVFGAFSVDDPPLQLFEAYVLEESFRPRGGVLGGTLLKIEGEGFSLVKD